MLSSSVLHLISSSPLILRRSFLLKKSKSRMPVGVMGKLLSSIFYWGRVQHVWRTGCVVVCDCDDDNVVVIVWEAWCGARVGVHFVFHVNKKSLSSSSSSSSSSFSSSSSSSFPGEKKGEITRREKKKGKK